MDQLGALVEGKYDVVAKLREGGMGAIYKVRHRLLDEIRIIKVMRQGVEGDAEMRRRFLEEAKTATRLKHGNICTIYDFAMDQDGTAYLVMEFIDGVTLAELLKAQGSPGIVLSLEIAHQTLQALGYLHRKSVVHRDIAPDNLMLTSDDEGNSRVKLIDLGIAKVLDRQSEMTSTGMFLGKIRYASPEQFGALASGETIDGRSDLYSLGLVLYELLTGRKAFVAESPVELMRAQVFQEPVPFERSDPEGRVPMGVRGAVLRALAKKREDRFASAGDFDREIQSLAKSLEQTEKMDVTRTIILVRRTAKSPPAPPTPSAEERLNQQFVAKTTPLPSPAPSLPDTVIGPEVRNEAVLEQIAREEDAGNRAALESLLPEWPADGTVGRAARSALDRLRERDAEKEKRRRQQEVEHRLQEEREQREREQAAWTRAEAESSVEGWERYLADYGSSPRNEHAQERLQELRDYESAQAADSMETWSSFVQRWPNSVWRKQAEGRVAEHRERALYQEVLQNDSAAIGEDFLRLYPHSTRADQVRDLTVERAAYEAASARNNEPAWSDFLSRFPKSGRAAAAREQLAQARAREEDALAAAVAAKTAEALEQFLRSFPGGHSQTKAESLLAETRSFEKAREQGREALEEFLRAFPKGRYRDEASRLLEAERERALVEAIAHAERSRDLAALRRLAGETAGKGPTAEAARVAISRLEQLRDQELREAVVEAEGSGDVDALRRIGGESIAGGRAAQAVREAISRIEAAREQALLESVAKAEETGDSEELQRLAREAARGSRVAEAATQARARIEERRLKAREEADWRNAESLDTSDSWQDFLRSNPESTRSADAQRRLAGSLKRESAAKRAALEEEKAWTRAQKANSEKGWERFLSSHPSSSRLPQARHGLAELQAARAAAEEARRRAREEEIEARRSIPTEVPAEKPAAEPKQPTTEVRAHRVGLRLAAALIAIGLAVGGFLYLRSASTVPKGFLSVDAVPWGRIVAINDQGGKNVIQGREEYTPASFDLPRGRYTIRLTNPDAPGKKLTLSAEVEKGKQTVSTAHFDQIDPSSYFAEQGFGK